MSVHTPVLTKEVLEYLSPKENENFIDCTLGEGGHSLAILEKTKPEGKVLGIEINKELVKELERKIRKEGLERRLIIVNSSYKNLKEIVRKKRFQEVKGILFDLGMSSWHLEKSGRGFSFLRNERLDMRYSNEGEITAEEIANVWPEEEIEKVLRNYSQERFSKRIARNIVRRRKIRPIETTFQLREIIRESLPLFQRSKKKHFATKTFQALRIAVNEELENLRETLPQTLDTLERGGRLVIIAFHSLEERIVKEFFKREKERLKILTKKPIRPTKEEIRKNPRSKSARLRAAEKI